MKTSYKASLHVLLSTPQELKELYIKNYKTKRSIHATTDCHYITSYKIISLTQVASFKNLLALKTSGLR